jgi:hypothetical protein
MMVFESWMASRHDEKKVGGLAPRALLGMIGWLFPHLSPQMLPMGTRKIAGFHQMYPPLRGFDDP